MAETNKYYWLKLKRDFFKRHDVRIIEEMPNGKDYILFYLKLLLESIDHEGALRFSDTIPYNEQMLSVITNTNIDIVRSAMRVFVELKMIDIMDDQTIYMTETQKLIGSETKWAQKKRLQRAKEDNVLMLSSICPTEKEKEKETETDTETDIETKKKKKPKVPKAPSAPKEHTHSLFDRLYPNYELSETLVEKMREWITYKVDRKEEYQEQGLKSLLSRIKKKCSEYGENSVCDLIDECMENQWKGIIWERLIPRNNNKSYNTDEFFEAAVSRSWEEAKENPPKTAGNDPNVRKKAEALKEMLG